MALKTEPPHKEQPMDNDPEVIWLGPKCEKHEREGRTWSTEPHDCPDCDEKAVKYIRALPAGQ